MDGTIYRNGFYGDDLIPINLTYKKKSFKMEQYEFNVVENEQFDWVHGKLGNTIQGVLYCAENQWETAKTYYADSDNFAYYCYVEGINATTSIALPNIDPEKFDELLEFTNANSYNPFGSNRHVKRRRLLMPDRNECPDIVFYKESNDGFFTTGKGKQFHLIDGKLLLVFYYDGNHGKSPEELVAVDVPDELGQYFIDLLYNALQSN